MHCMQLRLGQFVMMPRHMLKLPVTRHEFSELLSFTNNGLQVFLARNPTTCNQGIETLLDLVQCFHHFCLLSV